MIIVKRRVIKFSQRFSKTSMLNWPQYKYNENTTQKYAICHININFRENQIVLDDHYDYERSMLSENTSREIMPVLTTNIFDPKAKDTSS